MVVLVTGANGQLGRELRLASAGSPNRFVFTDIVGSDTIWNLDITDAAAVMRAVIANHAGIIVNCAAYTDVERAEDDPVTAYRVNCTAAGNLAAAAAATGATLIHFSTDFVFDGKPVSGTTAQARATASGTAGQVPDAAASGTTVPIPYIETDMPNPLNVYGSTKLEGEHAIQASGCKYLIFRTSWLYSPYGNNFVRSIRRLLRERDRIEVVDDQIGTPTYAADLAALIIKIIDGVLIDRTGVYHFCDGGSCSRYNFARAIEELSGLSGIIKPCTTAEYPTKALRPAWSVLDTAKVRETFGVEIPDWRDSLGKCISRM